MIACLGALGGCPDWLPDITSPPPEETWPTSLHATRRGIASFYSADSNGFELLTGIPVGELWCLQCHPDSRADGTPISSETYHPDCTDCHVTPGGVVPQGVCLKCHSLRLTERATFTDVHFDAGMDCMDCHTKREMHGDGTPYASMMAPGAMDASCEGCHPDLPHSTSHVLHASTVHCSACHAQSVMACYNCHFQPDALKGQINTHVSTTLRDFLFLVRSKRTGKVHAGSMVPLVWEDKSFALITPYASHTISAKGRSCHECHANDTIEEYAQTGRITVARWDFQQARLVPPHGVIPIPPDWQRALRFDFIGYLGDPDLPEDDPAQWDFLKSGADVMQMMHAEPLTAEQMDHLRVQRYPD